MKSIFLISIISLFNLCSSGNTTQAQAGLSADGTTMTTKFKVFGNCGMCKKRIEKAAKIDGVTAADWDVDSKILTIIFDETKVKPSQVHRAVAAVGHDTEKVKADDAVYANLHECCQYERAN
ncbi:MAG: heavy-metal-associated domain-containing protein [Saprospiraceae bacterium]|nr:heavy-metal-associated domain-containing protein [Saprospiraceae bacterium]